MRWGASDAEVARRLPGDDLVPDPAYVTTRAVTINAPPDQIWPWLAQMGELPRGGFYTYEWAQRAFGLNVANATTLLPRAQRLQVGQVLDRTGSVVVLDFVPDHYLVLDFRDRPAWRSAWTIALYPTGRGPTRVVSRVRASVVPTAGTWWQLWLLDPGHFLMERRMLLALKARVERRPP
jgi:hypothetical protein